MLWALINVGSYIKKLKLKDYTFAVENENIVTLYEDTADDKVQFYKTHISNVIISTKEPVITSKRN